MPLTCISESETPLTGKKCHFLEINHHRTTQRNKKRLLPPSALPFVITDRISDFAEPRWRKKWCGLKKSKCETANFRIQWGEHRIYAEEGALQRSGKQSRLDHAL